MSFDVDSSLITMGADFGYPSHLDNINPLSVSCWIYPINWGQNSFGRIICKEGGGAGWLFFVDNSVITGGLSFLRYRATTNTESRTQNSSISLNTWTHVGFTYRDSDGAVMYINGQEATRQNYNAGSGSPTSDNSNLLYVGNRMNPYGRGFRGYLEGMLIFERWLNAGEMWQLYASRHAVTMPDALFNAPINEGVPGTYTGTSYDLKDRTANRADGNSIYALTSWREGVIAPRRRTYMIT